LINFRARTLLYFVNTTVCLSDPSIETIPNLYNSFCLSPNHKQLMVYNLFKISIVYTLYSKNTDRDKRDI